MKKVAVGIFIGILVVGAYFLGEKNQQTTISDSGVLQEKLKNVSKLVVSEGHFSDVITYKDVKKLANLSWLKAEKKAVVLVNARATVTFDLSLLEFQLNKNTQTLRIIRLPEAKLETYPKLEYYDIQADFLNEFTSEDYNKISKAVDTRLQKQIATSSLLKNANNRLISELHALLNKEGLNLKIEYSNTDNNILLD